MLELVLALYWKLVIDVDGNVEAAGEEAQLYLAAPVADTHALLVLIGRHVRFPLNPLPQGRAVEFRVNIGFNGICSHLTEIGGGNLCRRLHGMEEA